jgi:hypothetical protein
MLLTQASPKITKLVATAPNNFVFILDPGPSWRVPRRSAHVGSTSERGIASRDLDRERVLRRAGENSDKILEHGSRHHAVVTNDLTALHSFCRLHSSRMGVAFLNKSHVPIISTSPGFLQARARFR